METAAPPRRAAWALLFLSLVLVFLLWKVQELMLVAFIAVLLSVFLGGFTDLLCRYTRLPRGPGLMLSLVLTLGALAGIVVLLAPAVAQQTGDLITAVPRYLTALDRMVESLAASSELLRRTGLGGESGLISGALSDAFAFIRRSLFSYAAGTGIVIIESMALVAMALYLAWRPHRYLGGLHQLVPPMYRETSKAIATDLGATLRAWVSGQLLAMVVLALATAVGLLLLDVPFWLAFSIFAGVAVMVPFFGSITSTLLPALLVLPDRGPLTSLAVAMVGVVVHVIEANLVHPLIMQHRVALPPALTIFAVLVMGALAGFLGMIVAVPLVASIVVLARHIVIYRVYGERPAGPEVAHAVLQPTRPSGAAVAVEG